MSDALDVLSRIFDGLLSLAFIAGAFLLWSRSKAAALLGASAGAAQLFVLLVFVAMDAVRGKGGAPEGVRLLHIMLSGFGNLVFYGCMIAMVLMLARSNETQR